jgi:ribosome biogenesis GTPase
MTELHDMGYGPFFEKQLTERDVVVGRIAAEHRGGYQVWSNVGDGPAQLAGRLTRTLSDEEAPGVGDWVTLTSAPGPDSLSLIERVLARRTVFLRGVAGRQSRGQVVAANIDQVFVVCGLDADYNLNRIQRYLARVWASGAQPVVVLNKADVSGTAEQRALEVEGACPGVPVLVASALREEGLAPIQERLVRGNTVAFVGSSGAGKSTLVNCLAGREVMPTSEVRSADSKGRHTTTHRQLFLLPQGGLIVDTPGMRELQLVDEEGIDAVFADIQSLAQECRFSDCTHQTEPGCAVQEAVVAGAIPEGRLGHYLKLLAEARAYEVRSDEKQRRGVEREFSKRIARDLKLIRRFKGGD